MLSSRFVLMPGAVCGLEVETYSRFQVLTALACLCLLFTALVCCAVVKESAVYRAKPETLMDRHAGLFGSLWEGFGAIDGRIKAVYRVQFFAWMAWFPLLFYGST